MGLKPRHTTQSIEADAANQLARIERYVLQKLSILGVEAANHARTERGYTDQTGNLVNSTGFVILKNGKNVFEDFTKTKTDGDASTVDGLQVGKAFADQIAAEFSNFRGWALLVVAGMEYASTVEKVRGKNVLAATELWLRDEFLKMLAEIESDLKNMKR